MKVNLSDFLCLLRFVQQYDVLSEVTCKIKNLRDLGKWENSQMFDGCKFRLL